MTTGARLHRRTGRHAAAHARGFTLIELMIAIIVSSIVVLGVFAFSTIQQTTAAMHQRDVRMQQALEGAMWTMGRDVRAAGLGFARTCTELRVWDAAQSRLVNPGGAASPTQAYRDLVTGEAYWVLRDGIQVHWDSDGATSWDGNQGTSAAEDSAADSFDVIFAEANYLQAVGAFTLAGPVNTANQQVVIRTHPTALDSGNAQHLAAVRQLFPPGTFFLIAAPPQGGAEFEAQAQSQCPLLQITDDVQPGAAANEWILPVSSVSGFNADLNALLAQDENGSPPENPPGFQLDDWDPARVNAAGSLVVPLGRLRWSRYEIDYSAPGLPYLVRRDIIGFLEGDPANLGTAMDYPFCQQGQCPAPQLHLPGGQSPPGAVAVGPMIEDMQVAVGCDGYSAAGAAAATPPLAPPDTTPQDFGEKGPASGPNQGVPNFEVDEYEPPNQPTIDEWLGNSPGESWAPDCVYYGTAQYHASQWGTIEGNLNPPPNFRMSPQVLRITLVASAETSSADGGIASTTVPALEDRAAMISFVPGRRERFVLTERFAPSNLRWRNPLVP